MKNGKQEKYLGGCRTFQVPNVLRGDSKPQGLKDATSWGHKKFGQTGEYTKGYKHERGHMSTVHPAYDSKH